MLYIILAILGLGFLIFIHELGHYYVARRVGMRVEAFGIGFGKAIYEWEKDGVKWRLNWLPFGGYVKIAGMEQEENVDLHDIPDGFFGKGPWARIKVALAGPVANLVFAFLAFSILFGLGGRIKNFSEFTSIVGWVDPKSELFEKQVKPGDQITKYDDYPFQGAKDHLYAPLLASDDFLEVEGFHVNYHTKNKTPFDYKVKVYPHPLTLNEEMMTSGVLGSASYIFFNPDDKLIPSGSPMAQSGILPGDRLVWIDGEPLFSLMHLSKILNDDRILITIERNGKRLHRRVPRVKVEDLKLSSIVAEELLDWQYAANLQEKDSVYMIPYDLTPEGEVQKRLSFIDKEEEKLFFPRFFLSEKEEPLKPGDRIVAVQGNPVRYGYEILANLQFDQVHVIVKRESKRNNDLPLVSKADDLFIDSFDLEQIENIANTIGSESLKKSSGDYHLLNPIQPITREAFISLLDLSGKYQERLAAKKQEIEEIEDPTQRMRLIKLLKKQNNELLLGLPYIEDQKVIYNPDPLKIFENLTVEIWRTLSAMATGVLSPKWVSGPVGIVQVVQKQWQLGIREALFWLGAISLNLGLLNLLPIPVLDGGYICISFYELITGKKVSPKTLERLIIPFAILLILFFIFLTFNDLSRIFGISLY